MTTAKEKAQELIHDFWGHTTSKTQAKKCALLAVRMVLQNIKATKVYHPDSKALPHNESFWNEVEFEIIEKI